MTQQDLPTFESQETPQEVPVPPKKPKPKPTRKRKVRKARVAAPMPKRRLRKKRIARKTTLVASDGSIGRVGVIIGAHAQIEYILSTLTKNERAAMIAHLGLTDGRKD